MKRIQLKLLKTLRQQKINLFKHRKIGDLMKQMKTMEIDKDYGRKRRSDILRN